MAGCNCTWRASLKPSLGVACFSKNAQALRRSIQATHDLHQTRTAATVHESAE